ncbi:MAG: leucyl/phenylalanyl-tRNA--protein transferase [Bacteroidota bacterium]|nr:leucyl/phenylalanyl-tRNA--protein transferase [Bacteroidota bacterium]MDX5429779.1 leucyl/phenylalanyl-tRNA--protein transferase [Bacteroidota bacterium]MDX5468558.1 leucyl/phenylalanyl-tRNA--protein transferase [Bacteroidota bacterium]
MNFLTPAQVIQGYTMGVFPMAHPEEDNTIYWYEPKMRGILPLDGLKVSKSLRRRIEKEEFEVTINKSFVEVIEACSAREETWISQEIQQVYSELHQDGWAHSVECWKDGNLVGGLYGVAIKKAFFGESMFHRATDASKVALYYLVEWLKENDFQLLDMQYLTPHLATLGGIEIPQKRYLTLLNRALK